MANDEVSRHLTGMDELDFKGWNKADWRGPGSGVGGRGPLIDSARSIVVTGCCVHDRGRSLLPFASRSTTSAMRAARRSGRRVVASI